MNALKNAMWPSRSLSQEEPPVEGLIAGKPYYVGPVSNGIRNWKKGITSVVSMCMHSCNKF